MQRLEVSGAVRHIYMFVIRRLNVNIKASSPCKTGLIWKNKLLFYTTQLGTRNKAVDLQSGGVSFEFQALLLDDSVTFV
jgi:hypothetical protein